MNPDPLANLENEIIELRARVHQIEEALRSQVTALPVSGVGPSPGPRPPPPPPTLSAPKPDLAPLATTSQQPKAVPQSVDPAAFVAKKDRTLENRIGSQWFNRIGILAVLIAVAWFLKLAVDNHWISRWIGPTGRVLIGLGTGAGIIALSERFRNRGYAIFSYSLKAVGSGTLYLALWASFSIYHLIPPSVAFAAMILVTAFNGYMAWIQDAELLGLYGIVGGLSIPLLLSTGENHEVTLLGYLLVLNIAVLVLVALRPWSRLLFGAFLGTVFLFGGWWSEYYTSGQVGWTAGFLTAFFLIFAFAPRLVSVDLDDGALHSRWDSLAVIVLPILNGILGFAAYYALLDPSKDEWSGSWLAVGFAAFYLVLLRLPARGRLRASSSLLADLHLTSAVVFLTLAIPLKAQGRWLTVGWLVEGAALLWVARRAERRLLRVLALLCLVLGVFALVVVNPNTSSTPIVNARFATYCVGIAVFAFVAWLGLKEKGGERTSSGVSWHGIAAGAVLTVNVLILLAIGWEIHSYWWIRRWVGGGSLWARYQMYAQFTYSLWFMIFGAILLGTGFLRRSAFLRWQALILLAITIVKVFLYDMSALSQGYRILSFLGLGVLLFAVSFVYQRDWLRLRAGNGEDDEV